jgi:midasin
MNADELETELSILDCHHATIKIWKALNVQNMMMSCKAILKELVAIHETGSIDKRIRDYCTGFTCDVAYLYSIALKLHDKILHEYMLFFKGTAKLQYVILRIFRVLLAKGFCSEKSKEAETQETGDESTSGRTFEDDNDGTGMGEGDGKTDVTEQLENEEQLLGLKSDKDGIDPMKQHHDPKQLNKEEVDQGMEMEGDFDGELYDLPSDVDIEDDKESKSDIEEVDRELGSDGSPNDEVIDEKMWDESDEGKHDGAEEKFEQNSSMKGVGAIDEMITKDESEGKDESTCDDKSKDTQSDKNNDTATEEEAGKINDDIDDNYENNQGVSVRDEMQANAEPDANEMNIDDNISICGDVDNEDDEMNKHDDETTGGSEYLQEEANAASDNEETKEDSDQDSETTKADAESNVAITSIPLNDDGRTDEEIPDEHDLPKVNLPNENISQTGLGVRDKDGKDVLQDEMMDESEEIGHGADGTATCDSSNMEPSGKGQGSGLDSGNCVSDASCGMTDQPQSDKIPNPLKSVGDATKFWHRKLNMMRSFVQLDKGEDNTEEGDKLFDEDADVNQTDKGTFEYTSQQQQSTMQALGEANEEEAFQIDEQEKGAVNENVIPEKAVSKPSIDNGTGSTERKHTSSCQPKVNQNSNKEETVEESVNAGEDDVVDTDTSMFLDDANKQSSDEPDEVTENHVVSDLLQLRVDDESACEFTSRNAIVNVEETTISEHSDSTIRWSMIQNETHNLSRRLCEKLRLVMEPLVASKLRGDYRTGKRINMKRVIGYIASGYRKDKIWLRRTKPAKRNYRVLVAVDDSESMLKNGAGEMALKAMATLIIGMNQLEVGEFGIASFGNDMNLIHPFQQPFTSESGSNIVQSFQFRQQRTRTALCIESAMIALEDSPGRKGVMQLVFMISDGRIERDSRSHIRKLVREMMEQNTLLVLIIVEGFENKKDSIMNMKEVTFDKGKPQFKHFIEDYPFPYYIVLNDMQALPEILGDALKQWFEILAQTQLNTR